MAGFATQFTTERRRQGKRAATRPPFHYIGELFGVDQNDYSPFTENAISAFPDIPPQKP